MKCPVCEPKGQASRVYPDGYGATTAMMGETFWDEKGVYHDHDPNSSTEGYRCSLGHRWWVTSQPSCSAGDYEGFRTVRIDGVSGGGPE